MHIQLTNISKKFSNEWILKDFTYKFETGKSYAITGNNGSGKSTLVKMISGILPVNRGTIEYTEDGHDIVVDDVFQHITYAAPYLELIEEFSLAELLEFHFQFKKPLNNLTNKELIKILYLEKARNKKVKDFSSGMKQRLKLGLALYSEAKITLLDEPTSNLDQTGINWYSENVKKVLRDRLFIIASNQSDEYTFCDEIIDLNATLLT